MKKLQIVLVMLLLVSFAVFAGGNQEAPKTEAEGQQAKPAKSLKLAMVTDLGGLGDQAFNDAGYRGLQRAEKELGADIKVVESASVADYETNIRQLSEMGFDMIFCVGNMLTDATKIVAEEFPNINYTIIDGNISDFPNVLSINYHEEQAAFLLGALAAKMSKTGVVGHVSGMKFPIMERFEAGFIAGARTANPDVKNLVTYTGKWNDPGLGKETALTQFGAGADIIAATAGACNLGVFDAAKELGPDKWAMGAAAGQSHLAPTTIMADQVKRLDNSIYYVAEQLDKGNFSPGLVKYGLKEGGVGLLYGENAANIPQEIFDYIDMLTEKIISGEIVAPMSLAELEDFVPPNL
jgi:basic membrane protein A